MLTVEAVARSTTSAATGATIHIHRDAGPSYDHEPFDVAQARLDVAEKIAEERWSQLERRLVQIETTLDRLEKRMWLAVYGAASLILANIAYGLLSAVQ
jgi:predicted lysophospholipase L1 biosynthesis ABC-type transport system permease subunit